MRSSFAFTLNGAPVRVAGEKPTTTLLEFLRSNGLTGSKRGCDEGDCGACTVAILDRDTSGKPTYRAINSCIALLPMVAGREIVTVEGLSGGGAAAGSHLRQAYGGQAGPTAEKLHPADCDGRWARNAAYCRQVRRLVVRGY